jgi:hypothetical protein
VSPAAALLEVRAPATGPRRGLEARRRGRPIVAGMARSCGQEAHPWALTNFFNGLGIVRVG